MSWELQYPFASFTYSLFSLFLFFYPSDIRLCGTDTWVSSKAVSSKCTTTEGISSRLTTRLPTLLPPWFVLYTPPSPRPPRRHCYVSSLVLHHLCSPVCEFSLSICKSGFVNKMNVFTLKVILFYIIALSARLYVISSRDRIYWFLWVLDGDWTQKERYKSHAKSEDGRGFVKPWISSLH